MSLLLVVVVFHSGCTRRSGNIGNLQSYGFQAAEADWIRNGEPIEFEEGYWYPADDIEVLIDAEVYVVGEFRGVQIFVDKLDVRPYRRLYTKFGRNKFRFYEKMRE